MCVYVRAEDRDIKETGGDLKAVGCLECMGNGKAAVVADAWRIRVQADL